MTKRVLGDVEYAGKVLGMTTFKEHQKVQDLIKKGQLMPASDLARAKEAEAKRAEEFTRSIEDEQSHQKSHRIPVKNPKEANSIYTRERFED
jgi:hypothetical protein